MSSISDNRMQVGLMAVGALTLILIYAGMSVHRGTTPAPKAAMGIDAGRFDPGKSWKVRTDHDIENGLAIHKAGSLEGIWICDTDCGVFSRVVITRDPEDTTLGNGQSRFEFEKNLRRVLWDNNLRSAPKTMTVMGRDSDGDRYVRVIRQNSKDILQSLSLTDFGTARGRIYVAVQTAANSSDEAERVLGSVVKRMR